MKRLAVAIAAFFLAAPAFAQDYGYGSYSGDDDSSWQQQDEPPQPEAMPPDRGPTFDDFRADGELSWNGEWVTTSEYGTVWRPTHVGDDWQPYTYGRWVWTAAGWAWASDESFGWAVYHYGRWAYLPGAGWAWVPGRVWAPAWVAWRWNDGYTGWCPLGPRGTVYEQRAQWVVVPNQQFLQPVAHHVVPRWDRRGGLPPPHGPRAGPPIAMVERSVGRQLRPLSIGEGSSPSQARAGSGTVYFYRPRTAPVGAPPRPSPSAGGWQQATPRGGAPRTYGGSQPRPVAQQPSAAPVQQPHAVSPRPGGAPPSAAPAPHAAAPHAEPPHAHPQPANEQPRAKEQ